MIVESFTSTRLISSSKTLSSFWICSNCCRLKERFKKCKLYRQDYHKLLVTEKEVVGTINGKRTKCSNVFLGTHSTSRHSNIEMMKYYQKLYSSPSVISTLNVNKYNLLNSHLKKTQVIRQSFGFEEDILLLQFICGHGFAVHSGSTESSMGGGGGSGILLSQ